MSWVASVIALIDVMVGAGSMGDGVFSWLGSHFERSPRGRVGDAVVE
jgi:hypothetical protein